MRVYNIGAFLFDMDGTLVDSTPVIERTWKRYAQRHQLNYSDVLKEIHGRRAIETISHFTPHIDIKKETAQILAEEMSDLEGVIAIDHAKELLLSLPETRWAVVTSAERELALRRLKVASLPIPHVLITAEDVIHGKPAPEGYLAAAKALGFNPADCLVFEDAPAGLAAANAAGMRVVAVGKDAKTIPQPYEQLISDYTGLKVKIPVFSDDPIILYFK